MSTHISQFLHCSPVHACHGGGDHNLMRPTPQLSFEIRGGGGQLEGGSSRGSGRVIPGVGGGVFLPGVGGGVWPGVMGVSSRG